MMQVRAVYGKPRPYSPYWDDEGNLKPWATFVAVWMLLILLAVAAITLGLLGGYKF